MQAGIKSILGNGLPYGFVFFILSFLLSYYSFHLDLRVSVNMSILIGLAALFFTGIAYNRFSEPLKKLEEISFEFVEPEIIIVEAPANHSVENHLVPGKLFLTNQRLIFKEYRSDNRKETIYFWSVNDLKPIGFYGSIKNAGGEFLLKTQNDHLLMFEVNILKVWKQSLQENKLKR